MLVLNFTIKPTLNFGAILFRKNSHTLSAAATLRHINKKFDQMIRIRINEKEKKVSLSLRCQMAETVEREFNLNRSLDEPISATFQKLYSNFSKQLNLKAPKSNKKLKKEENLSNNKSEEVSAEQVPIYLFDLENKPVQADTKNLDAWKENYMLKLNEQTFQVTVNLPFVRKLTLSKLLIDGMFALVKADIDAEEQLLEDINLNSKFEWFYSQQSFEPSGDETKGNKLKLNTETIEWIPLGQGVNMKACQLNGNCQSRLIKVRCIPSDGKRDGLAFEVVSNQTVLRAIDLNTLPMTQRHELTKEFLNSDK